MFELATKYRNYLKEDYEQSFVVFSGKGKVFLSCPHAVSQLRNGATKAAEPETGVIALTLNEMYGYPVIVKTSNKGDDANYDAVSPYKDECVKQINDNHYRCLLDLHLLNSSRAMDINIGARGGQNIKDDKILNKVINAFNKHGFTSVTIDKPFGAFNPNTISTYINKQTGIDTLQIEINSKLVYDKQNHDYKNTKIDKILETLNEIIVELNSYYEE